MGRRITFDVPEMFRLYHAGLTFDEMARRLGVPQTTVSAAARSRGLKRRARYTFNRTQCDVDVDVPPEEAAASEDSLRLSPWVQARIKELRLGMPA